MASIVGSLSLLSRMFPYKNKPFLMADSRVHSTGYIEN